MAMSHKQIDELALTIIIFTVCFVGVLPLTSLVVEILAVLAIFLNDYYWKKDNYK
jgi:TctA family transporter